MIQYMLANFTGFLLPADNPSEKQFESRSDLTCFCLDLGPNCLH